MGGGRGGLPDTKRGGGGGQSTSGPIYEKWGGGAIHFRPITKSGGGGGGGQFTSGPLRKVGGGGGQFTSGPLRKVGGGGGAIRFRSITKRGGGGQFASGPLRKVGGERCKLPPLGSGAKPQKLRKPAPAPHKRTLTLLGGGGSFEPPEPPLATSLMCVHACMQVCGYVYVCAARVKNLYV